MTTRGRRRRWGLALFAACGLALSLARGTGEVAAEARLQGAVGGELQVAAVPGLGLRWRAELDAGGAGLAFTAQAKGLSLRVEATPGEAGAWRWRIAESVVDVPALWPVMKEAAGPAVGDWEADARIALAGEGTWSPETGPTGHVVLTVREAWARSEELGVEVTGIEADVRMDDVAEIALAAGQSLRVAKIAAGAVTAERLELRFGVTAEQVLEVSLAELEVLGGKARIKPFAVSLAASSAEAAAEIEGIALGELAKLMPEAVSGANGRLSGNVKLKWDGSAGFRINDGGLAIVNTEEAVLKLAPSPGFLTGNMPRRLVLLPAWLGPLSRWSAPKNPAYAPLEAIEMGRTGLIIDSLEVKFNPDDEAGDRKATVRLRAHPVESEEDKIVEELTIDINLSGALTRVLALGMDERVKLKFRAP